MKEKNFLELKLLKIDSVLISFILRKMIKKLSYIIFVSLNFFDQISKKIFNRSFLIYLNYFIQEKSYKTINVFNQKIKFFIPSPITEWRVNTFFTKEPETLEWIDKFEKNEIIFWDIGANIGLYSIYNALKNKNSKTFCFEPSSSNLRTLTRNISINNLEDKISVLPIALSNKKREFQLLKEGDFVEGGALNSFGENFNFEGKQFISKMSYKLFGTSIDSLIEDKILTIPDYVKIDVDGIEHLILEGGATNCLKDKKLKSVSIEINENFSDQYNAIIQIMKKNNFDLLHKKNNLKFLGKESKFSKSFNYVFIKK